MNELERLFQSIGHPISGARSCLHESRQPLAAETNRNFFGQQPFSVPHFKASSFVEHNSHRPIWPVVSAEKELF